MTEQSQAALFARMNLDELSATCIHEIESGIYSDGNSVRVEDLKILAWYRDVDDRPNYVDSALCWARISTGSADKWVVVHMGRNPIDNDLGIRRRGSWYHLWEIYRVYGDEPRDQIRYFDQPPTAAEMYSQFRHFKFESGTGWRRYASFVDAVAWEAATGEGPR